MDRQQKTKKSAITMARRESALNDVTDGTDLQYNLVVRILCIAISSVLQ
jgi:hypothetical protein